MGAEVMLEQTVTLRSGRTAVVGELDWGAYKRIKSMVARVASEKLSGEAIAEAFKAATDGDPMAAGISAMRVIGAALVEAMDEMTPVLVAGCLREKMDVESLGPVDVLKLRAACLQTNDMDQILGLEGNVLAAVAQKAMALIAAGRAGGSQQSTSSPQATAGVSLT